MMQRFFYTLNVALPLIILRLDACQTIRIKRVVVLKGERVP